MKTIKRVRLFIAGLLLGCLVALLLLRAVQLHMINKIIENDFTMTIDHRLYGFYPSDYETIDDGNKTVIYFEYEDGY